MKKTLLYLIVIIIIVVVVGGTYYLLKSKNNEQELTPTPTPSESNQVSGVEAFTSQKLGISFEYNKHPVDLPGVSVKEEGNKVYVYMGNTKPETGQWVEVFSKNKNETFEASIKRQILANYPSKDCKIEVQQASDYPAGFLMAQISYPQSPSDEWPWVRGEECNGKYAITNGIRYFLYDLAHPDKFLYFDIGQYAITASDNEPWQDTVRFLK